MKKNLKSNLLFALLMLSCSVVFSQGTCGEIVPFASEPVVNGCDVTYEMDLSLGVNWTLYPGNGLPQSASVSSINCGCGNVYTHTYTNAQGVIYPNISYYDENWKLVCSSFYPITIDCQAPCTTPPDLECSIETSQGYVLSTCDYINCDPDCVVLSVTEPGFNPSDYSYQWSSNTPVGAAPNNWYTQQICESGYYTLTISDAQGCTQVKLFDISVNSTPSDIVLSQDGPLTCDQTSVTLNTNSSGYCYDWGNGITTNSSLTVTAPGEYCVTVSDCFTGCDVKVCQTVTEDVVVPDLACSILDESNNSELAAGCSYEICDGGCVILSVNGNSDYTYAWDPAVGSVNPWESNKICEAGTYTVTITGSNGCQQVKTFDITTGTAPEVTLSVDGTVGGCLDMVTITATEGYCYEWSDGLGTDQKVTVDIAGEYCVTVTDCVSNCETVECITVEEGPGTYCNVGLFSASAEINGVAGGGPYLFADGLTEGEYLCWEFRPKSVPDWMIITVGGVVVLNTGNVAAMNSSLCSGLPYSDYCDCVDYFLGNGANNRCIDLIVGTALLTQVPGGGINHGDSRVSGSILITPDLACKEITVTIGNNCGEEYDVNWNAFLYCCSAPTECTDGYFPPPTNSYCCRRTDGSGTTFQWDEVDGAVGYIVTIDQEGGNCCPDVTPGSTTPIKIQVNQNYVILPDNLPDCFNWYAQAVGPNGEISAPGPSRCHDDEAVCFDHNPVFASNSCLDYTDYDLAPCPANPEAPGPVDCTPTSLGLTLDWPAQPWAIAYTIVVDFGPSTCCPNATESSTFSFQTTENEIEIPATLGSCFTYSIYSICEDFTVSPRVEGCIDGIIGCSNHGAKPRNNNLNSDLFSNSNFAVFPNPADERINISFDADQEGQVALQLRSMEGRVMKSMSSQVSKGGNIFSMDTGNISAGIYFLQLEVRHQKIFKKVVIQN